ncbi:hypothetical protein KL936_003570 [Ogataea polymorpha]|nr:hypothetical protein KL936_003570 [Ogataea polymorpha]
MVLLVTLVVIAMAVCQAAAKTHTFFFETKWITANPDGVRDRQVISFNGSWPLPTIEVNKGDSVEFHLINGLDVSTSLHFHGLLQNGSNHMDGPVAVTQCPIPPGESFVYEFTVEQVGTYWYHSHSGSQYSDGLRGLFIVHDEEVESNYKFDKELVLSLSDWYHDPSEVLIQRQLSLYNPTGAEPIPQNTLINDTKNITFEVEPDTTYLIRIANIGIMSSQYLFFEDHDVDIIEVDGVYVHPARASMIYLAVGQRMSILLKTKSSASKNFGIVHALDISMLDALPADLQYVSVNQMVYDRSLPDATLKKEWLDIDSYAPFDDFELRPLDNMPLLPDPDHRIDVVLHMENLGDGVNYAFFNNYTYVAPKVPTLLTALSAPKEYVSNAKIYGSNTNSFLLSYGDVVELVVNNEDDNKHPFHLHGHQFQTIVRSEPYDDPHHYDPDAETKLPEIPVRRDTMIVEGNGHMVLRFEANNPGIWFFHCHLDFHLEQGLALTLIEAPLELQEQFASKELPEYFLHACKASETPYKGNAAANTKHWLDLTGENVQPPPLPDGFTFKGYVALAACTAIALYGLKCIYSYGMGDLNRSENVAAEERKMVRKLMLKLNQEQREMLSSSPSTVKKREEMRQMIEELEELDKRFRELE